MPDLRAAAQRIAALDEQYIRDYEQGLCFFCGEGHEPVPGPRGGTKGERKMRPIHDPDCSYIALRDALDVGLDVDHLAAVFRTKRWMLVDVDKVKGMGFPEPEPRLYRDCAATIAREYDALRAMEE